MARTNKYSSINFNDIYDKKLKSSSSSSTPLQSPYSSTPSSPSSSTALHSARNHQHGRMLVLTRPTPKPTPVSILQPQHHHLPSPSPPEPAPPTPTPPQSHHHLPSPSPSPPEPAPPTPTPPQSQPPPVPDQTRLDSDFISLRPLGRSGSGPALPHSPSLVLGQDVLAGSVSLKTDRFVPPHLRPGFVGRQERLGSEVVPKQIGIRPKEYGNRQGHHGSPGGYREEGRPKSGGGNERMRRGGGEPNPVEMSRPGSGGNRPSSRGWVSFFVWLALWSEF